MYLEMPLLLCARWLLCTVCRNCMCVFETYVDVGCVLKYSTHYFQCEHGDRVTLMLSQSVPVYQVKLDWLPLYCLDSAQPAELSQ